MTDEEMEIVRALRTEGRKVRFSKRLGQEVPEDDNDYANRMQIERWMAADAIERLTRERDALAARVTELEAVLAPFAAVGRLIAEPFGPALFKEDDAAFGGGCAWTVDGETKTLTWGDFRTALATKTPPAEG